MKKLILILVCMLLLVATYVCAEVRSKRVSPTGKEYTLVLMAPMEFDNFLLTKRHLSQDILRAKFGEQIVGFTLVSRRRCSLLDNPSKWWANFGTGKLVPYAWVVYLPAVDQDNYDRETLWHEVYYHVDQDVSHTIKPNVRIR